MSKASNRGAMIALASCMALAGCSSGASLNPFTWFSRGAQPETLEDIRIAQREDARPLVVQVTSLRAEPVPGGVILRATGLPPTQGWYDAALVSDGEPVGGVQSYALRAFPPVEPQPSSTVQSRELVVGAHLSDRELDGVREIRVRAGRNAISVRR